MIIKLSVIIIAIATAAYYALVLLDMAGFVKWTGEKRKIRLFPFYYFFDRKKKK
jgi:hypothetical protein